MTEPAPDRNRTTSSGYLSRLALFYGCGALFLALLALVWFAGSVLLLAFSSVLVAVLLHGATEWLRHRLHLPRLVALTLVVVLVVLALGLVGWLLAPATLDQAGQLAANMPASVQRVTDALERFPVLQRIVEKLPAPGQIADNLTTGMLSRAESVFSGVLGGLANLVIIVFVSLYLAAQPQVYLTGLLRLLPMERRERGLEVFSELGDTLMLWLVGKLFSMAIIGAATGIGLALLGVPLALALGVVAGLLDFIPYIGPLMAAVPALLIAFSKAPELALYTALLFIGLQTLEGYILLPLVERRTVSMPPGLTIMMQVLLGLPFGLGGVALATPLTAVICVVVSMLYVQDVLGDKVALPSEQNEEAS